MQFTDVKIRNVCKKCGKELIEQQRFIVTCCGEEMERFKLNRDELNSEDKMSDEETVETPDETEEENQE